MVSLVIDAEDVVLLSALRALDLIGPGEIVEWAAKVVGQGEEQKMVINLAGLPKESTEQIDSSLQEISDVLGLLPMTEERAGLLAAVQVAREVGAGTCQPIDAARKIWHIANLAPASEPNLRAFIGLASEWDDDPAHRDLYEEEIRAEALRLGDLALVEQ